MTGRYINGEDVVEISRDGVYTTYTRGTNEPLYHGPDPDAARRSLDMTALEWNELIMSDEE